MSATFTKKHQAEYCKRFNCKFSHFDYGPLDRRNIDIQLKVTGQLIVSMKKAVAPYLDDDKAQVVLYSNFAACAQGKLYEHACNWVGDKVECWTVAALTGDTSKPRKSYLAAMASGEVQSENELIGVTTRGIADVSLRVEFSSLHDDHLMRIEDDRCACATNCNNCSLSDSRAFPIVYALSLQPVKCKSFSNRLCIVDDTFPRPRESIFPKTVYSILLSFYPHRYGLRMF
jgi:hypothetical protein